ncbi:MAG TPA: MFS transporter [Rhizobiaceae bacterium]|nr:MFS transporter [Rhizobiaceae bacterium]
MNFMNAAPLEAANAHGGRFAGLTLVALCLAVLVAQVDTAVVNLAVRPIGAYFHASVAAMQWIVDSYNLVYAVLLLTGGLLADLYGRRLVFMAGALVFTLASFVCAFAPSVPILIFGRAAAGLGAALIIPSSLAIIRVVWQDPTARGRALGIWAACNGLAFVIGPTLGGLLIHHFGWPSVFLVVTPLAIAALALAPIAIPESRDPAGRHFDAPAQAFGMAALGGIAFAAIESHGSVTLAVTALAIAATALIFFIRVESARGEAALVPLDIFRIREFRGAAVATTGMTFGMYGILFLLPLTWQGTGRLDATQAGIALIPMALVFVIVSPFSGALVRKFGAPATTGGGVAIIGLGLLLIGASVHEHGLLATEIGLALTGLGMGFATGPLMGVAVGAVAASRSGTASSLINVARMAGATIGVASLGSVFALAGAGPGGLRAAMVLGGCVQIACALYAWTARSKQR